MSDRDTDRPQYTASMKSIWDTLEGYRDSRERPELLMVEATLTVALSNMAVAEAIHRVAAAVEHREQVVVRR